MCLVSVYLWDDPRSGEEPLMNRERIISLGHPLERGWEGPLQMRIQMVPLW